MTRQPAQTSWWQNSESLWLKFKVDSIDNLSIKVQNNVSSGASSIKFQTQSNLNNLSFTKKIDKKKFECIEKSAGSLVFKFSKQSKNKGFWDTISTQKVDWLVKNEEKQSEFAGELKKDDEKKSERKCERDNRNCGYDNLMNAMGDAGMTEIDITRFNQVSISDNHVESDDDEDFDINNYKYPGHDWSGVSNRGRIPQHQRINSPMMNMLYQCNNRYQESLDHWSHKISTKPCEIMKFFRHYDYINGMKSGMTKKHYFREMALNKTVWYEKVVKPEEFLVQVYRNRIEDNYVFGGGDENLCGLYTYPLGTDVEYEIFHDFLKFIKLAHLKSIIPASFDFKKCMKYATETLISAIDESEITDTWKKKENNFNSLSGMRKVGEQIYGEYAADTPTAFEDKVGERAKRAIKTEDEEFFKNIGGKDGWFEFYHGLDLSMTREANGDEEFSDDDDEGSESSSGTFKTCSDSISGDSEMNEIREQLKMNTYTLNLDEIKNSSEPIILGSSDFVNEMKTNLPDLFSGAICPPSDQQKLQKNTKKMERTSTTLKNQKIDTSKLNEKAVATTTSTTNSSKGVLPTGCDAIIADLKRKLNDINNGVAIEPEKHLNSDKKIKEMEQTLTTLKNQIIDTSKLTKFSVPPVTDYNNLNLDGYTVKYGNSHFMSENYNRYENDQPQPVIVQAAGKNDLVILIKLIRHANKLPEFDEKLMVSGSNVRGVNGNGDTCDRKLNKIDHKNFVFKEEALNASAIITEVAEKHGYDKSWEWYDDTALHSAIRKGNDKAVKLLLYAGADPTLKSGHEDNANPTPLELVQKPDWSMNEIPKKKLKNIEMMLTTCVSFWNEADYSSAKAGWRMKWNNRCIDLGKLRQALELTVAACDW